MHQKIRSVNRLAAGAFLDRFVGQPTVSWSVFRPFRRSTNCQPERSYSVRSVNRLPATLEDCKKSVSRLPASKGLIFDNVHLIACNKVSA